ncbi:MAG TPA: hypothetical protein VE177_06220, partial [Candidatus Binatus sp.]|nr:hypothetical protein [Candidatus Binatus sp.]
TSPMSNQALAENQRVAEKPPGLLHFPGIGHFLVVAIFTGIEIIGLIEWLQLLKGGDPATVLGQAYSLLGLGSVVSRAGTTGLVLIILGVFLLVEHTITQLDATGRSISGKQLVEILIFSSLESAIWYVWWELIPVNGVLAFSFFVVALFVEHHIADNVKKGLPFLKLSSTRLVTIGLVVLTLSEVIGSVIWVGTGLLAALAVGSLLEHYIARNVGLIR